MVEAPNLYGDARGSGGLPGAEELPAVELRHPLVLLLVDVPIKRRESVAWKVRSPTCGVPGPSPSADHAAVALNQPPPAQIRI